jgi:hypothetical protein
LRKNIKDKFEENLKKLGFGVDSSFSPFSFLKENMQ